MAAVRLHLRLDEFMEHAEMPYVVHSCITTSHSSNSNSISQEMLDIPKWDWEKSSNAFTSTSNTTVFNSATEWILTPDAGARLLL